MVGLPSRTLTHTPLSPSLSQHRTVTDFAPPVQRALGMRHGITSPNSLPIKLRTLLSWIWKAPVSPLSHSRAVAWEPSDGQKRDTGQATRNSVTELTCASTHQTEDAPPLDEEEPVSPLSHSRTAACEPREGHWASDTE